MKTSPTLHGGALWVGHGKGPVDFTEDYYVPPPPEGQGDLKYSMYMGKPITDYPEGCDYLEKMRWRNYQDKPQFKLFPSYEENMKMWQEIDMDRHMDYQPPHEIYAKDLPDYHFWPMIANDIEPKRPIQTDMSAETEYDQTEIPRFHKNGVPKTPREQQVWYIPKLPDGRFDWKKNAQINNRNLLAYCSEEGWNARYYRRIFRPFIAGRQRSRGANVVTPLYFRHRELPTQTRTFRFLKGSYLATGMFFIPLYSALMAYIGSVGGYYDWNWVQDGPWNPDMTVLTLTARDRGCYHGII